LDAIIRVFEPYDVSELARTGKVLMARGSEPTA